MAVARRLSLPRRCGSSFAIAPMGAPKRAPKERRDLMCEDCLFLSTSITRAKVLQARPWRVVCPRRCLWGDELHIPSYNNETLSNIIMIDLQVHQASSTIMFSMSSLPARTE